MRLFSCLSAVLVIALLGVSCGLNLGSLTAQQCDPIGLNDSQSAHFEVRGDTVRLLVDGDDRSESSEVFGTDLDSSNTFIVSVNAAGESISAETPGVEAVLRGSDSAYLDEVVAALAPNGPTDRCEVGDVRIDYVTVEARTGFQIGDQDYPISDDVAPGGFFVQTVLGKPPTE